jgi:PAS domain S-box-containing protein
MNTPGNITVLFVDDEPDILSSLNRFLRREPYRKLFAESGSRALDLIDQHDVSLIVSDLRMPVMNGLELISEVKKRKPQVLRMILSGSQDFELIINSINMGEVFRFVPKPVEPEEFRKILDDAIDYYCLKADREELFGELSRKNAELTKANEALQAMTLDLRRSEEQFRSMTDAAHDAVFMVNREGTIVYRNNAAESIFGYDRSDCQAQPLLEIISAEFRESSTSGAVDLLSASESESGWEGIRQIDGLRRDGTLVPLEISRGIVSIESVPYTVLIARDITARVEAERSRLRYENMQRELETSIERKLLQGPFSLKLQGAMTGRMMISSGHLNGDFADHIEYGERHADVLVGDVMGHGIQSALIGAGLKSLFLKVHAQKKCRDSSLPPLESIVGEMHELCINELLELGSFATLLFLRSDLETGRFSMVNCGHPPLIHYRASTGRCSMLKGDNLPMGMIESWTYTAVSFTVEPGDVLVLYSDGITECSSPDNELFGDERLVSLIESCHRQKPGELLETIREAITSFSGRKVFNDDVTCLAISIN